MENYGLKNCGLDRNTGRNLASNLACQVLLQQRQLCMAWQGCTHACTRSSWSTNNSFGELSHATVHSATRVLPGDHVSALLHINTLAPKILLFGCRLHLPSCIV